MYYEKSEYKSKYILENRETILKLFYQLQNKKNTVLLVKLNNYDIMRELFMHNSNYNLFTSESKL